MDKERLQCVKDELEKKYVYDRAAASPVALKLTAANRPLSSVPMADRTRSPLISSRSTLSLLPSTVSPPSPIVYTFTNGSPRIHPQRHRAVFRNRSNSLLASRAQLLGPRARQGSSRPLSPSSCRSYQVSHRYHLPRPRASSFDPRDLYVTPWFIAGDSLMIARKLRKLGVASRVDDSGASIGKKYARNDELGTPFGCTVDFACTLWTGMS